MSDGRPAGPVGAAQDDNGAGPGRRRVYGGAPGACETAAAVGIRCYRHEGVVVTNRQRVHGLGRLAGTWELTLADGRTLTAPAALPDLRPGETAAVPLGLALPVDGGALWLTLRVVTTDDRPGTPRGTTLCAPRIQLRGAVADSGPAGVPAPLLRTSCGPPTVAETGPARISDRRFPLTSRSNRVHVA
ncbi:DUF4981 domain-containing protein [Streptomyces actinomycinicus]|uniref:DUF4981 domain-containing protein n=1 Tax=Streptomyces actinomycinicus TaxID=1695166 RepID=A0A937EP81_9ACTN|nr:DUF4981 domain-containing protein [Streptomyces actinomycinicus]